jgi:hypothetical protein
MFLLENQTSQITEQTDLGACFDARFSWLFVLPYTIGDYCQINGNYTTDSPEFEAAEKEKRAD